MENARVRDAPYASAYDDQKLQTPQDPLALYSAVLARFAEAPEVVRPHVPRERLLRRLDAASVNPIVLVSAPAGWGKTTLVASWIAAGRAPGPAVYLSMAAPMASRDLHRFRSALAEPTSRAPWYGGSGDPAEPVLLVVDDLHRADPGTLSQVRSQLDDAPTRLRVVVLSRTDPPLPLYRWRLAGRLSELRADHLSFTATETDAVLRAFGVDAASGAARSLRRLTDGWPAAVVLAATAAADRTGSALVAGDPCASAPGIADYLDTEILRALPADLRAVLPHLALVEVVCPELVEALTGRRDGGRILAELERETGLVRRGSGVEPWYRCHDLLRAVLRRELAQWPADRLADQHRAAADWYIANNMSAHGLAHKLDAGDWSRAARLVRAAWPELLAGRIWSAAVLPPAPAVPHQIAGDAWLALAFAAQRRAAGDPAGMRQFLHLATVAAGPAPDGPLARVIAAMRLTDAPGDKAPPEVRESARRVESPPDGEALPTERAVEVLALCTLADADLARLDLRPLERTAAKAVSVARRTGSAPVHISALDRAAIADLSRGRLGSAANHARVLLATAGRAGSGQTPEVGVARLVLAGVCIQRGQVDEAGHHLDLALSGDVPADPVAAGLDRVTRARLHQLTGESQRVLEVLRDDLDRPVDAGTPALAAVVRLIAAEVSLATGQPATASQLIRDSGAIQLAPEWAAIVETKLRLAQGQPEGALLSWRRLRLDDASTLIAVEGYLVQALAYAAAGHSLTGWRMLERALRTAEPERIVRPFLVNGAEVNALLVNHLSTGTGHPGFLVEVIRAAGSPAAPARRSAQLVEALTEREAVVLRCLNSTLSTAEIADVLNVSSNTVKTHVKSVYRKLAVTRRRDAVRRSYELGFA